MWRKNLTLWWMRFTGFRRRWEIERGKVGPGDPGLEIIFGGGMTVETVFEWVTIGVSWLVIVTGGLAVVAGLLYLADVLITRIVNKTKTLAILFDFVKNRKDFKLYKKDRGAWEEKRRKAIRGYLEG